MIQNTIGKLRSLSMIYHSAGNTLFQNVCLKKHVILHVFSLTTPNERLDMWWRAKSNLWKVFFRLKYNLPIYNEYFHPKKAFRYLLLQENLILMATEVHRNQNHK